MSTKRMTKANGHFTLELTELIDRDMTAKAFGHTASMMEEQMSADILAVKASARGMPSAAVETVLHPGPHRVLLVCTATLKPSPSKAVMVGGLLKKRGYAILD